MKYLQNLVMMLAAAPPFLSLPQAIDLSRNGDHQASERIMKQIKNGDATYNFYRMINLHQLNNKEGIRYADNLIHSFYEIPARYKDMAIILKADMETWKKKPDDLEDIAREMNDIQNRLKNNKGGPETRKKQEEVLARLKKKIDDLENPPKGDGAGDGDGKDEKDKDGKPIKGKGKKVAGKQQPGEPPPEAPNGQAQGTGQVDQKKVKEIAEVWGKLPEKERAKALVGLMKGMPPKDRAVIEAYLKELQKRSGEKPKR